MNTGFGFGVLVVHATRWATAVCTASEPSGSGLLMADTLDRRNEEQLSTRYDDDDEDEFTRFT